MVDLGGILGFSFSGLMSSLWKIGAGVAAAAAVAVFAGVILYYVIRPLRYKIRIVLWANRAGNVVEDYDRAMISKGGFLTKSIIQKLRLLKRKVNLPIPDPRYFIRGVKGDTIYFYKFGNNDYAPILPQFSNPDVKFVPSEADTEMWHIYEQKEMIKRNTVQDIMSKYGPLIAIGAIVIVVIIVTWMITGVMKQLIGTAGSVGESMRQAAEALGNAKGG